MAKFTLIPYTSRSCDPFTVTCELNQNEQTFFISYLIDGNLSSLDLDDPTPSKQRILKLWEKSCFELFLKNSRDEYLEFNFSPHFEWNCFYFKKKGDPLEEWKNMKRPETDILLSLEKFFLVAEIKKKYLPQNFMTKEMSAGISTVLKMKNKELTYWALSHEDLKPNFHHFDSFKYKF
jgi:hypothetical protein